MKKRSLVTGGAGFLGSHLCEQLLRSGHEVICLDNLLTSTENNISHLLSNSNFSFLRQDVTMPFELKVDWIFNLASPASPVQYQSRPVLTTRINVLGALNVLELAKATGARIFQASTSEVYGSPAVHPQKEDYWGNVNPVGPRSCYDEGKRCVETLFFDYYREFKLDIRVGRIFNTFGPRMQPDDGRVVSNFIMQALKGESITLYGDGSQTRSFCYVNDMVEGIIRYMEHDQMLPGPINLGNPEEIKIRELAELIIEMTGSSSKVQSRDLPQDDPAQRQPDITLAKNKLNWAPTTDIQKGLLSTIQYFREYHLP